MDKWPVYKLSRNKKRVALNPALVSAIHEKSKKVTEVYTLDCAKDDDAWDIAAPFDEVLDALTKRRCWPRLRKIRCRILDWFGLKLKKFTALYCDVR